MTNSESPRVISRIVRQAPYDDLQRKPYYQPFSLNIIPEITFYFTPEVYPGNAPQGTDSHYHYSSEIVNIFDEIFKDNASSIYIANRKGIYFDQQVSNAEYIRIASEIDANIALSRFAIVAYSLAYLLQASGKGPIALSIAPKLEQLLIQNNPYGLNIRPEVFANARKIYEMTLNGELSPESLLNIINDTKVLDANLVMIDELFSLKNIFGFIGYVFYQVTGEKLNYSNQYVTSYMSRLQEVLEYAGDDAISRISPEVQALVAHRAQVNAAYQPTSKHLDLDMFPDFTQASVPVSAGGVPLQVVERLTEVPPLEVSVTPDTPITPTDTIASTTTTKESVLSDVDLAASLIAAHEQQQITSFQDSSSSTAATIHTVYDYDTTASTVDELEEYGYASYGDIVDQAPADSEVADVVLNTIYDEVDFSREVTAGTTIANQETVKSQLSPQELLKLAQDSQAPVTAISRITPSSIHTAPPNLKLKVTPEVSPTHVVRSTPSVVTSTDPQIEAIATAVESVVTPATSTISNDIAVNDIAFSDGTTSLEPRLDSSSELEPLTEIVDEPVADHVSTVATAISNLENTSSSATSLTTSSLKLPRYDQEHLTVVKFPTELEEIATSPAELANLPQETTRDASDFNDLEDYDLTKLVPDAPLSSFQQPVGDTIPTSSVVANLSETHTSTTTAAKIIPVAEELGIPVTDKDLARGEVLETDPVAVFATTASDHGMVTTAMDLEDVVSTSSATNTNLDTDTGIGSNTASHTDIVGSKDALASSIHESSLVTPITPELTSNLSIITTDASLAEQAQANSEATYQLQAPVELTAVYTDSELLEQVTGYSLAELQQLDLASLIHLAQEYELTLDPPVEQTGLSAETDLGFNDILDAHDLVTQTRQTMEQYTIDVDGKLVTILATNVTTNRDSKIDTDAKEATVATAPLVSTSAVAKASSVTIASSLTLTSSASTTVNEDTVLAAKSLQQELASSQSEVSTVPTALMLPDATAQYLETSFSHMSHRLGLDIPDPMHDQAIPLNQRLKMMQENLHLLANHHKYQGSGLIGRATAELASKPAHQLYQDSIQRQQQYVRHYYDAQVAVPDIAIPASRKALYKQTKQLLQQVLELRKRELTATSSATTVLSH